MNDPNRLEYASPNTSKYGWYPHRVGTLICIAILAPILWFLSAIEFAQEPPPPGNGHVLDDVTRAVVAVIITILGIVWIVAFAYLAKRRFRLRGWRSAENERFSN